MEKEKFPLCFRSLFSVLLISHFLFDVPQQIPGFVPGSGLLLHPRKILVSVSTNDTFPYKVTADFETVES